MSSMTICVYGKSPSIKLFWKTRYVDWYSKNNQCSNVLSFQTFFMISKTLFSSFLFAAVIFSNNVYSQSNDEPRTLFGNNQKIDAKSIGFFVAPSVGVTSFDRSASALFHARGGFCFKSRFTLGGYYAVSMNEIYPQSETIPFIYMDYWSAGGFVEYTVWSKKLVHLTLPVSLGISEVQMDDSFGAAGLGEAKFFQIEPSAMVELNLHKYVRLNAGAGYRFVSNMNYRNFNQNDVSGLTGYLGLKIGLFR